MVRGRWVKNNGTMKSLYRDPVQPFRRFNTALRLAIGLAGRYSNAPAFNV